MFFFFLLKGVNYFSNKLIRERYIGKTKKGNKGIETFVFDKIDLQRKNRLNL